ncbi:LysM peptidoglycan-binding domain-containing protein (plasmid) [Streptomyces sp. NBC_01136]|uniref:LysM peptidoglycan-binding domain-containing protein n=1 Tax=Streptomyces sp. NBC_01136 TaxID=2903754 RepID=UPI0037DC414B|nr:LysM peptidoglycan-binding domain-containing protein [Streptomyces sp. NBC_01136]
MSTPVPPQAPAAGGSLVAKVGGPRNAAILGAGLTVALVALLAMRKDKSGAANGGTTTITGDTAFDSGPYDMWDQWQSQYEQLQQQVSAIGGGTTTATGPGTPAPPVQIPKPPVPPPAPKPPAPPGKPKPPTYKTVTVKKGDTLSGIAARNHITMAQLKKLNPTYWTNKKYKNGNLIWAGDKVKV